MRWPKSAASAPCRGSPRCCRRAMPRRCRSWCARSASSATRKLVDTLLPLVSAPASARSGSRRSRRSPKLVDERARRPVAQRAADAGRLARSDHRAHGGRRDGGARQPHRRISQLARLRGPSRAPPRPPPTAAPAPTGCARRSRRPRQAKTHADVGSRRRSRRPSRRKPPRGWTSARSSRATSSRAATSTSTASAAAPSAPCC